MVPVAMGDRCLSFLRWRVLRQRGSYARHTGAQDLGISHGVVLSSNGRTRDVVRTVRELMYCYGRLKLCYLLRRQRRYFARFLCVFSDAGGSVTTAEVNLLS